MLVGRSWCRISSRNTLPTAARLLFFPVPQSLLEEGLNKRARKDVVAELPSSSSQDDIMLGVVSELVVCRGGVCWDAAWAEVHPHLG